jgi:osmoprotectant transport system ATP-binding protein
MQVEAGVIELLGVSRSFGAVRAVRDVSLSIRAGSTTALIGPSGCGKSTLLRLTNGLLQPDAGRVRFGREEVTPGNAVRLRRRMGYVIQSGGLFPHFTARENVCLVARYLGQDAAAIRARIDELVALTRFPPAGLDRYPAELSGGQCQRVGLMRALMLDPSVLLLDEPLGALDPMIRRELQDELKELFRTLGRTVILVTHDLEEARFLADRIVLLRDGEIAQDGSYEDLVCRPASDFVTRFVRAQRRAAEDAEA